MFLNEITWGILLWLHNTCLRDMGGFSSSTDLCLGRWSAIFWAYLWFSTFSTQSVGFKMLFSTPSVRLHQRCAVFPPRGEHVKCAFHTNNSPHHLEKCAFRFPLSVRFTINVFFGEKQTFKHIYHLVALFRIVDIYTEFKLALINSTQISSFRWKVPKKSHYFGNSETYPTACTHKVSIIKQN